MSETRTVTVEREFAYPPEKLWRALTQPHLIEEWLMKNDFAPRVGHQFAFRADWGGVLGCEVLAVEPNRVLSYSWNFGSDDPNFALESVVTFTLTPTAKGTQLRMEQSGFRPEQRQAFGGAILGWQAFLVKLDELLARSNTNNPSGQRSQS
ncbi:MAG: SRPBCC domain-containing protein [Hyphomicrobiaceae bacterium]|nr:SRPBCC domain-containing protein [Hyphomicrobiaceae bacterium]